MWQILKSLADPDLQIRKGGGYLDPQIRGGGGLKKNFLGLSGLSFVKKGGGRSPGSATENGGRTKPIAKYYATHGHEPSGSESTVGSESVSLER